MRGSALLGHNIEYVATEIIRTLLKGFFLLSRA